MARPNREVTPIAIGAPAQMVLGRIPIAIGKTDASTYDDTNFNLSRACLAKKEKPSSEMSGVFCFTTIGDLIAKLAK